MTIVKKHITQPYLSKKCGQACLAMITGKSVEEISKELKKEYTTNIREDLQKYLEDNGFVTELKQGCIKMKEIPKNSIVRLNKPDNSGHFIIKNEVGKLLDPNVGTVEEYSQDRYTITHYLTFIQLN